MRRPLLSRSLYFNYAGVAPISFRLLLQLLKFLSLYFFSGPRPTLLKYEKYIPLLSDEIARLLNCKSTEISYIKNTTEGIVIAAESLPLQAGDEVLVLQCEYPANLIPWLKKRGDGINVRAIAGADSPSSYANLLAAISEKTKVIAISWVQFADGYVTDIAQLSAICQKRGIFLVVDAVQIVGTRVIDLSSLSIDILVCGGHKHLMSVMGSGFMYINRRVLPQLRDFKVGIRSVQSFNSSGFILKESAARFEDGSPNFLGIVALYHRVKVLNRYGLDTIEEKGLELLEAYKEALTTHQIDFVNYNVQGNMLSIRMENPLAMMAWLEQHRVYVKAINNTFLRVAFSFMNSKEDIDVFIKHFKSAPKA